MVCIKLKNSNIFYIVIIISILIVVFCSNYVTALKRAELQFEEEPSYTLLNRITKNGKLVGWRYQIDIKIKNVGNHASSETVVNISDEEGFSLRNITYFEPGETKTISFIWSTLFSNDQIIKINYFPLDLDTIRTKYNSGSTSFKLIIEEEDEVAATSTPGFEFIALIISILSLIIIKKKKINKL